MEKVKSKEIECVALVNYMHKENWYKWTDAEDQIFTIKLTAYSSWQDREPDNFDKVINNVDYSSKSHRSLVFDFKNRVCKWNAYYKVYETQEYVLASSGECAWDKIIDAAHEYIRYMASNKIRYNGGVVKSEQLKVIYSKYLELQEAEIKTFIDAELEKLLVAIDSSSGVV